MNRELGEGLKLFLKSGSDCESVIWRWRKWRRRRRIIREIRSSKVSKLLLARESTVRGWELKESRRRNTFKGLRCCLDLYDKKTEKKGIKGLFIPIKTSGN
jgi:hypothetical protein